jgi:hypothetical protein
VLLAAEGSPYEQIAAVLASRGKRCRARFVGLGRAGLEHDALGRGREAVYGPEVQAGLNWENNAAVAAATGVPKRL